MAVLVIVDGSTMTFFCGEGGGEGRSSVVRDCSDDFASSALEWQEDKRDTITRHISTDEQRSFAIYSV